MKTVFVSEREVADLTAKLEAINEYLIDNMVELDQNSLYYGPARHAFCTVNSYLCWVMENGLKGRRLHDRIRIDIREFYKKGEGLEKCPVRI